MQAQVLNGKKVAEEQKSLIKAKAQELEERLGRPPGLAAVLVGHNGASETYVAAKMKACAECGMHSFTVRL
ncbi:MAG: bifunctional methylenetetrahydrofolate dehydrogenase/methenyltetrahydrofolate cyclohydrolase, partial [Leptospiraceae bacterium]|nr:bifunctional methylenetetrahydrofolate dehydrogenase/methenyltetrahydrofolate cyclohydrolase [Leptospiraceae bacterium]